MEKEKTSKYTKGQRILALAGIVLIVLMYLLALIFSLLKYDWAKTIAQAAVLLTVVVPVLIWAYIWMAGKIFHKHTIADFDLNGVPTDHSPSITVDQKNDKTEK